MRWWPHRRSISLSTSTDRETDTLDLLVIGDLNPDLIVAGEDLTPRFGQTEQLVSEASLVIGGSAAITAVGAARLGLRVGLCAVVGDDDFGRLMSQRLADEGVDCRWVRVVPARATGISVILDQGRDRAILTALGAIDALDPSDLKSLGDRPARHVHVASYFLLAGSVRQSLPQTFHRLRAAGVSTSVDTNWDPTQRWDVDGLLGSVDLVLPNQPELAALTGVDGLDEGLRVIADLGSSVACKLGDRGASLLSSGRLLHVDAAPSEGYIDAIGAGDSFNAGFLCGTLSGLDVGDSLRLAVATGSLSTRGRGGTATQPDLATAQELAQRLTVTTSPEAPR